MKTLIVGCRGMLGSDLMQALASHATQGLDLPDLDITDASQCRAFAASFSPEVIVDAAALTDVDYCESHEEEALRVNGQGTANLAQAAHDIGAMFVYYSTDYIFDGSREDGYREEDAPHPLSVYGRSKLRGEELARALCPDHLILRTSWLFGCHGKNFIRTILQAAKRDRVLRVVDDQRGSPTYTRDLAARTLVMLNAGCRGSYHVTNSGSCSWHELASYAVEQAGLAGVSLEPVKTHEFPRPAPRPACSILVNARSQREGFGPMPAWQEAVRDYVGRCLRQF